MGSGEETLVRVVEVGPRDGLQNVSASVATDVKIELIQKLLDAGLKTVELTSIVSPRAVPQLSDNKAVLSHRAVKQAITSTHLRCPVLIPNERGLETAKSLGVREVAVFVSAAEGFSRANTKCSIQEGLKRAKAVAHSALQSGIAVRGYVSCIFACPYDGPTPQAAVLDCVQQLLDMGCYEVSLGDTIGVGCPAQVQQLISYLTDAGVHIDRLAGHFHDTYGQALANVWSAYQSGLRTFDSSVAGLGGCPFAPGARGNVATEDVVYLFHQAGISTGVDMNRLVQTGRWISTSLARNNGSRAGVAILAKKEAEKDVKQPAKVQRPWKTRESGSRGIKIWRSGTNLKLQLNRPRNGNALTADMLSELTAIFDSAKNDTTITRIAITAQGKYFCTGMDISADTSSDSQRDSGTSNEAQFQRLTRLFKAVDSAPQVTLACVQGPAFGGGVGLAFACDIRIFAQSATMTLSETRLGLCPAVISKYIIREWGPALARDAMLLARPITAAELARLGLISQVLEGGDESALETALDQTLMRLRSSSPSGSAMSKELIKLDGSSAQDQGIHETFKKMMGTSEGLHGLKCHQSGVRDVDWDTYVLGNSARLAKL